MPGFPARTFPGLGGDLGTMGSGYVTLPDIGLAAPFLILAGGLITAPLPLYCPGLDNWTMIYTFTAAAGGPPNNLRISYNLVDPRDLSVMNTAPGSTRILDNQPPGTYIVTFGRGGNALMGRYLDDIFGLIQFTFAAGGSVRNLTVTAWRMIAGVR